MILNSKHLHVNLHLNYYFINFPRLASHFYSDIPIIFLDFSRDQLFFKQLKEAYKAKVNQTKAQNQLLYS